MVFADRLTETFVEIDFCFLLYRSSSVAELLVDGVSRKLFWILIWIRHSYCLYEQIKRSNELGKAKTW